MTGSVKDSTTQPVQKSEVQLTNLEVTYADGTNAVRGLNLELPPGTSTALVGESGCGKSTVAKTLLGLLPLTASVAGSVRLDDRELIGQSEAQLRQIRGRQIGYVAQNPFGAMHPLWSVRRNVEEAWRAVGLRPPTGAVVEALEKRGIAEASRRSKQRPHTWSGGMLQRAAIAAAVAHDPGLLIADEPTSALDAELTNQIVGELCGAGSTVLIITHNIASVAPHVDRIAVCYAGVIVEHGATSKVVSQPRHPYTAALLRARIKAGQPLPEPLAGGPPDPRSAQPGCSFAPRCAYASNQCLESEPEFIEGVACHHPQPGLIEPKSPR